MGSQWGNQCPIRGQTGVHWDGCGTGLPLLQHHICSPVRVNQRKQRGSQPGAYLNAHGGVWGIVGNGINLALGAWRDLLGQNIPELQREQSGPWVPELGAPTTSLPPGWVRRVHL